MFYKLLGLVNNMIFIQHILKAELVLSQGIINYNTVYESGSINEEEKFSYSENIQMNMDIIYELEKRNYFFDKRNIALLNDYLWSFFEYSNNKGLEFTALLVEQTEHVKINNFIQKKDYKEDYRKWGYVRFVLSKGKQIYFKNFLLDKHIHVLVENMRLNYNIILDKIQSKSCNKKVSFSYDTKIPVLFAPGIGGYFIHEVLGHMIEGDYVFKGLSLFGTKYNLGDKIGSECLSVVDNIEGLSDYIGLSHIDDEGYPLKKIQIIKNGILTGFLCDSKNLINNDFNFIGCSRRQSYLFQSMPRMRGTFVQPHSDNIDIHQLVMNTQKGILIEDISYGQVDPFNGRFLLSGNGRLIENGVYKEFVDGLMISGDVVTSLKSIEVIGNDFVMYPVQCYKRGQIVNVCVGAPSMKINNLSIFGGD